MPLQPAYTWSETEGSIRIAIDNVPIKDQGQLFCSDRVVKLNVPPYLLLLDLKHAVDDDRSTATITKGRKVVINLTKTEPRLWKKLTADGDACDIRQLREESVKRAHQKLLAAQQQRQARKQQEERAAVDLQIKQQKAQRDQLEALKQQELQEERQELQSWQKQLPEASAQQQQQLDQGDESDYEDDTTDADAEVITGHDKQQDSAQQRGSTADDTYHGRGYWPSKAAAPTAGSSCSKHAADAASQEQELTEVSADSKHADSNGSLQCLVGAQSSANGSAAACKSVMLNSTSTDNTAADEPFLSASSTRRITPARAADTDQRNSTSNGHSPAGSTGHCSNPITNINSSSSSSSQLQKPVAPVRSRAAPVQVTFTQLETPHLPAREQREVEIKQIKQAAGHKSDSLDVADRQPAFLKDKGDAFAAAGNYMAAVNAYTKALELDPQQAALWANRAAAHLALGQAQECVQDCDRAIALVEKAQADLLAAPGAATELELQAGMLGAAGTAAAAAAAAAAASVSAGPAAEAQPQSAAEASAGAVSLAAQAVNATTSNNGADADSGQQSTPPPQQQQSVANNPGLAASSAEGQECQVAEQQVQASKTICSTASGVVCSTASSTTSNTASSTASNTASSTALRLKQLLVKLLSRRAAARVELQQLQEALKDLQQALRLDPSNLTLKADALEVQLALSPNSSSDPAALKELAGARFKAGDLQGAADAFGVLANCLLQQQQQQQQQTAELAQVHEQQAKQVEQQEGQQCPEDELSRHASQAQQLQLAGALSNCAACWLGLNRHEECVQDCWAAFGKVATATYSTMASGTCIDSSSGSGSSSSTREEEGVQRLQQTPPELLLQLTSKAHAQTAVRSMSRLAAACVCLKEVKLADAAFDWAAACWQLLGEDSKVAVIRADQAKLQQMQGPEGQ